jgi:anhydro-N-acetylmuramic acid kinase
VLAVGLMSGTSMDGVDAALIRTDGEQIVERLAFTGAAYDEAFRTELRAAMATALGLDRPQPQPLIDAVARDLTLRHAAAVAGVLARAGVSANDVAAIGFHGQTVAHRPERGWTWQIGDAPLLAQLTGIAVVSDFRSADVAAGGQGAPLAPAYHRALVAPLLAEGPIAVLNLGGVGNITWFDRDTPSDLWGSFDTGPGNALIDDWVRAEGGLSHDAGGGIAATGSVHDDVLTSMLDLDWFDAPPPKSLDRADFSTGAARGLSLADGAATLTAFTAATVAEALRHVPVRPRRLLVTGGGRHNMTLMRMLAERTGVPTLPVETAGWNGDALEAEAFGYLAVRSRRGLALSYPQTTGVRVAQPGGVLTPLPT